MAITLEQLHSVVANDAAIRRVQRLQPAGGPGDKIFPPTYPGEGNVPARHVFETRRIDGQDVRCVLIDSVQSQANRLEEALLGAVRGGRVALPHVVVDFSGRKVSLRIEGNGKDAKPVFGRPGDPEYDLSDFGKITSLDAPHRVFDAIIRDSMMDGLRFEETDVFRGPEGLLRARPHFAMPLFRVSPTALLFGVWHSTGKAGGLGARFARCVVSEIIGVGASPGRKVSSRMDPLGVQDVPIYQDKHDSSLWTANPEDAALEKEKPKPFPAPPRKRAGRPSLVNHGNVTPSVTSIEFARRGTEALSDDLRAGGGVTIDYALHTAVITCAGLRRLKFPGIEVENAGRAALAAVGLVALTEQDRAGYALRSRCDLVCDGVSPFQIVHPDGTASEFTIDADGATGLLRQAVKRAKEAGFPWEEKPVRLMPQQRLVELVALSQAKAVRGESEGEEDSTGA